MWKGHDMSELEELYAELTDMLQPGNRVRIYCGKNSPQNKLCHIRAIVDDDYIVYKYWMKHKQRWEYKVVWTYWFQLRFESGNLSLVK